MPQGGAIQKNAPEGEGMARVGYRDNRCPQFLATEGLKRLNGRWKAPILVLLCDGPVRYAALKRSLRAISDKVLAQQLKSLERDGLIERREVVEKPPKIVEYRLGPIGEAARPALHALTALGAAAGGDAPPGEVGESRLVRAPAP